MINKSWKFTLDVKRTIFGICLCGYVEVKTRGQTVYSIYVMAGAFKYLSDKHPRPGFYII